MSPISKNAIQPVWRPLIGASAWIISLFCSPLAFPLKTEATSTSDGEVIAVANIAVALAVGILTLMAMRSKMAEEQRFWLRFALGSILTFAISIAAYLFLRETWTCDYDDGMRLVMGENATSELVAFGVKHGLSESCHELLLAFGGDTRRMYDMSSILRRFLTLGFLFVVSWTALTSAVISIAFGIKAKKTRKKPGKSVEAAS